MFRTTAGLRRLKSSPAMSRGRAAKGPEHAGASRIRAGEGVPDRGRLRSDIAAVATRTFCAEAKQNAQGERSLDDERCGSPGALAPRGAPTTELLSFTCRMRTNRSSSPWRLMSTISTSKPSQFEATPYNLGMLPVMRSYQLGFRAGYSGNDEFPFRWRRSFVASPAAMPLGALLIISIFIAGNASGRGGKPRDPLTPRPVSLQQITGPGCEPFAGIPAACVPIMCAICCLL